MNVPYGLTCLTVYVATKVEGEIVEVSIATLNASSGFFLDPPDLQALAAQPVHQPLFDPRWQREVAVAATAQLFPLGLIDVRALVARAARGLPVVHFRKSPDGG
jgi:hypothetical protein